MSVNENHLWAVVNERNQWLWYGRGTSQDAVEGAKEAEMYSPFDTLYLLGIAEEVIVVAPSVADAVPVAGKEN